MNATIAIYITVGVISFLVGFVWGCNAGYARAMKDTARCMEKLANEDDDQYSDEK